ncbi:MAG: tRNA (cytidine(56)-2'-O)-methyltransferase [Methanimicrococcus sp.]|nr:tRNA (cytidine(56)-2'-O)-methyltransferase [Methanimicrococcus sp.]
MASMTSMTSETSVTSKEIVVLRLGHRPERDKRITTHVGLTARALGACGMLLASDDKKITENITEMTSRWGGDFFVKNNVNMKKEIEKWKEDGGKVCHLSMYGINLPAVVPELKEQKKLMIIVGAEKVPGEVYELADWNVAVGNQPHSEVAALAVTMDRISESDPLTAVFDKAELTVVPMTKGKKVIHENESKDEPRDESRDESRDEPRDESRD